MSNVFGESTRYPTRSPQSYRIESGNSGHRSTNHRAEMPVLDSGDGIVRQPIDYVSLCSSK